MIWFFSWLGLAPHYINLAMLFGWIFGKREFYPGYGLMFDYKDETHTVFVSSRFTQGPAGRAGIGIFDRLLQIDGDPVQYSSKEEFIQWYESHMLPRYLGKEVRMRFRGSKGREYEVVMKAELTTDPPVYYDRIPHPNSHLDGDAWRVTRGMAYCRMTDQWVPTQRLSREALDRVFRNT